MLEKQDIHTSPCLQSKNHVSVPQNGDTVSRGLHFALEETSVLADIDFDLDEFLFSSNPEETENHQRYSNEVSIISTLIAALISVQCRFTLF
jgi:hypothetical protein